MMTPPKTHEILAGIANEYPPDLAGRQSRDIPRIAFNMEISLSRFADRLGDVELCDIGGGIGLFSPGCAAMGLKRTVLLDDFQDPVNHRLGNSILDIHRRHGIDIVSSDVIARGLGDVEGSFDVVTSFDSMEHWHNSPKALFHEVAARLRVGGVFVLGVPNCVNLRKRLSVPFGMGSWSPMGEWYEEEVFRGHVREPSIADLTYIANDMGLVDVRIIGRNWLGHGSPRRMVRAASAIIDRPMRLFPGLCSDIYMVGVKGSGAGR